VFGAEEGVKQLSGEEKGLSKSGMIVGGHCDQGGKVSQDGQKRPPAGSQSHFQDPTTEVFTEQLTQIITSCARCVDPAGASAGDPGGIRQKPEILHLRFWPQGSRGRA